MSARNDARRRAGRRLRTWSVIVFMAAAPLLPACHRAPEGQDAPPARIREAADIAALEAALANARIVRDALMRYPAVSGRNRYPSELEVGDYETLRRVLDIGLPESMADLRWNPGRGIAYRSDGYTFTLKVQALTGGGELITITEDRVTW